MQAIVLAAGRGVRMLPLTQDRPKPLVEVRGRALIDWHLQKLAQAGFTEVVINLNYKAEALRSNVGDGRAFGLHVSFSHEPHALDSAGGMLQASRLLSEASQWFALISADIFSDIPYEDLAVAGDDAARQAGACFWVIEPRVGQPGREFGLQGKRLVSPQTPSSAEVTLANVAVISRACLAEMQSPQADLADVRGVRRLLPSYQRWVDAGLVTARKHVGLWDNVTSPDDVSRLNAHHD